MQQALVDGHQIQATCTTSTSASPRPPSSSLAAARRRRRSPPGLVEASVLGTARESPRSFVWFFGWLVLLLPLIQLLIVFSEKWSVGSHQHDNEFLGETNGGNSASR